jgi:hypothetical protein
MTKSAARRWQPLLGKFDIAGPSSITYHGSKGTDEKEGRSYPRVGMIMSDQKFTGGAISARISYKKAEVTPSVQFVVFRNPMDDSNIRVGLEGGEYDEKEPRFQLFGRFSAVLVDNSKQTDRYSVLSQSTWLEHPETEEIQLRVENIGSSLDVLANGVLILRHALSGPLPRSQCGLWFRASGDVQVEGFEVDEQRKRAFTVMQFSEPYHQIFADVIRPVIEAAGLEVDIASEFAGPGFIIKDIVDQIRRAEVIVADITPENPNVFYELGYADAIGKPAILLAERGRKLPFDVSGMRVLFYENTIPGKKQLEEGLARHLAAILSSS